MGVEMEKFAFLDLEETSCNDDSIKRKESEIIEFGLICVDRQIRVIDSFSAFIKPVRHPLIHPFCTKLTKIKQSDLDMAKGAYEVFVELSDWLMRNEVSAIGSWGNSEKKAIKRDSVFHGIEMPIGDIPLVGLNTLFSRKGLSIKKALILEMMMTKRYLLLFLQ